MSESWAEFLRRKAGEPSTWKGIGWVLVSVGVMPIGAVDGLVAVGLALVGMVDVIRKENK